VTKEAGFEYIAVGAVISVLPSGGQLGTLVTISGTGLLAGGATFVEISLGGVKVLERVSVSDSEIVVRAELPQAFELAT